MIKDDYRELFYFVTFHFGPFFMFETERVSKLFELHGTK